MLARYYSSSLGRFMAVDPASESVVNPQTWNRYSYSLNNPILFIDPDGKCSSPSTPEGSVGICAEGFIASERIQGIGYGDNRTFSADNSELTSRVQVQMVVTPATGSTTDPVATPGVSEAGWRGIVSITNPGTASASVTNLQTNEAGTTTFTLNVTAQNGLNPFLPSIDMSINFEVTQDGLIGMTPGGATDGYPSVGVYGYRPGESPVTLFENPEGNRSQLRPPLDVQIPAVPPR
jgi:hypothetical protein